MKRRSILFAAALAAMSLLCPAAQAAGIPVINDSGTFGAFILTNTGISGGVSTLSLRLFNGVLQEINGADVTIPGVFTSPITLLVTPLGGDVYSIATATYTKTFGTSPNVATLDANLTLATAPLTDFFNAQGHITAVPVNSLSGYDFSTLAGATGNITLTATNFSGFASSFATVISTVGTSAIGSGAFSARGGTAVPEPASLALLGIGISGLLTIRRCFKRASVA